MSLLAVTADTASAASRTTSATAAEEARASLAAYRAEAASDAPPGFPDIKWDRWPEWSIWTSFAQPDITVWNAWIPSAATGEQELADMCRLGRVLHSGGPLVKDLTKTALAGAPADRRLALTENSAGKTPVELANSKDWDTAPPPPGFETEQQKRWLEQIGKFQYHFDAPEFDTETREFRRDSHQRTQDATFEDLVPRAGAESVARVAEIIDQTKASDEYFVELDRFQKELAALLGAGAGTLTDLTVGMSADDARMFLQAGGFPKTAPEAGTVEFRTEVEALKTRWANCDHENASDPYRVMGDVVETARAEYQAELDTQSAFRNTIVDAESLAYDDLWNASFAMVEAVGQAWVAEEILAWQRSHGTNWVPTAEEKTRIETGLKETQTNITKQLALARSYVDDAEKQVTRADTAQAAAFKAAAEAGTPPGRGLAYAQQSVQVAKASAAGAKAAYQAANTALQASKATVADNGALFSRARAEANALEAEYRRVAAQENAAQATTAANAAAAQATKAEEEAVRAKEARVRAETAEAAAKKAADEARAKRLTAEAEKKTAAEARKRADTERAKADAAEKRAAEERKAAGEALADAEAAGAVAESRTSDALAAEIRAADAKDRALEAERKEDAAASRAAAYEAAAAAAEGTEDAAAARAAATDARNAANEASAAAGRSRAAADDASAAAVAARVAADESTAAAKRSRAAAEGAKAAAATTHAQATAARAAAADAIDASEAAGAHARAAEAYGRVAAANAVSAKANAAAARSQADQARAESAVTTGQAWAAAQAATAASDAAALVIDPANEAISLGSPHQARDASAGMAVLVGQSALSLSAQQAAAAQARADEAAEAAQAAKEAADRADADAVLAATAAATAAQQAAKAAVSVTKAQASARAAAADASAAQTAAANATKYEAQAAADATAADTAATDAEREAASARAAASAAELDAEAARASANAAEGDASAAHAVADRAEQDALSAEAAAENAQASAREADAAATRAEAALQERIEAARAQRAESPVDTGAELTADEEKILLAACGQTCVDQWRAAKAATAQDVLDWVKANGGQIILDVVGYNDAKACFTKGDVEGCLWTLINAASLAVVVAKLPQLTVAVGRVVLGIKAFFEASAKGRRTLKKLREIIEKARRDPDTPPCLEGVAGSGARSLAAAGNSNDVCDLDWTIEDLPVEKLDALEDKYGIDAADGVDYNWGKMMEKGPDGKPTKNANDHAIPGIGTNIEELAKYFASWRGKATHIDPNTGNKVAFDATKKVVIIIKDRYIHGYKMTLEKFNSKYNPLTP
ncbi:hypothetical protein ACIQRS_30450 [Streptomyces termitum]|uniref:Uncharacterized protein n=1 Tax=Streptomyces termitum TaxID=67368 RepID=A0A918W9C4_9ACTN|nr:hypothetical protein [Streptomyces termitum]GHA84495.1 hypothetical protein GCM10010305_30320 [Streptomyces termitum]